MSILRTFLKKHLLTSNTIRYRIEYRCAQRAFQLIGSPIEKLMDAGAGSGEMSLKALRDGYAKSIVAIEPMPENYKKLEQNFRNIGNTETINASLEKIPLPDHSVDGVITTQVFEHIEDHLTAAKEVARTMKPGGYLIFSVPHPPEIFHNEGHVRPGYTEEEILKLWEPLGYSLLKTEYFFVLSTLHRLAFASKLPFSGRFLPISWADCESKLSNDERRAQQPYGILCLLRKSL